MNTNDVAVALRQSVSDHLGHEQSTRRLKLVVDAFASAANLVTIQSAGGEEIYASGVRMDFDVQDPMNWGDAEEHIRLTPFVAPPIIPAPGGGGGGGNNPNNGAPVTTSCPIENVPQLEVRVGNRIRRFADCTRVFAASWHRGRIEWCYIFDDFVPAQEYRGIEQPTVDVSVVLTFKIPEERGASWIMGVEATNALANPANFTSNDLVGPVIFDHLSFHLHFREDSDIDDEDEHDDQGENDEHNENMEVEAGAEEVNNE